MQTICQLLEKYGKEMGIDYQLRNKKGVTVGDIRVKKEKQREMEVQMEKKKMEEKVVRKQEKN